MNLEHIRWCDQVLLSKNAQKYLNANFEKPKLDKKNWTFLDIGTPPPPNYCANSC